MSIWSQDPLQPHRSVRAGVMTELSTRSAAARVHDETSAAPSVTNVPNVHWTSTVRSPCVVDVEQVRAKLLAGVNFEQVHAELMAALGGIAAGKGHSDLVEVPGVGTTIKILYAVQRAVQFLYEPFEPNDIQVVDRA